MGSRPRHDFAKGDDIVGAEIVKKGRNATHISPQEFKE